MKPRRFDENGFKECKICKILKTKEDYYPCKEYYSKFRPECKECGKRQAIENNKKFPKSSKKNRIDKYKRYYDISIEDYDKMFEKQKGVCKICGLPQKIQTRKDGKIIKNLHVDHCHISKKVRGLLCHNCNFAIGYFKESEKNLINALKYIADSKLELA
jgi:hypothetical protein